MIDESNRYVKPSRYQNLRLRESVINKLRIAAHKLSIKKGGRRVTMSDTLDILIDEYEKHHA
jgi:hypothetical protein